MIDALARRPAALRVVLAVVSGVLTALAFQPFNLWPLAFLGVAGLSLTVLAARGYRGAAGYGLLFGLGFLGLGLNWMQVIFLEALFGLVGVESLFFLALGLLIRLGARSRWWPLLAAASWVAIEFTYARFPFNGFGWLRLGYAMADSPLAWAYPLVGVPGVSLIVALIGQGVAWWLQQLSWRRASVLFTGAAALALAASTGVLVAPGTETGSVQVGWVQGGAPGGGVYGLGPARTITKNQLAQTVKLADQVDAGTRPQPDFVVWPENSTDADPFLDAETGRLVQAAVARLNKPLLVGAILAGPGAGERQTASLWWDPRGGVTATYIKRGIVPFGEWVPMRELLLPLIPQLAYVGDQSIPGDRPGVMNVQLDDGRRLAVGVLVCYDLAFDSFAHDLATNGAQVVVVQSSNAMYQGTGQIDQQFAMTRVRAMELRREILVVTTSGVSGLIEPDGSVAFRVGDHSSASGVVSLPERDGITPASLWSGWLELIVVAGLLLGLGYLVISGRMNLRQTRSGAKHARPGNLS
ncbi:apolipoprotein N-acyltransferase [Propionicimonas paludicola]|uniref:Apolipoprotein N-acyltransferase n=1 Tax=Propionicimonas paludicola TaxID=185243 RepID=A0A2A9CQG5_9ACTN|nr:apolipoprotein N-acyltransferase [Propionicimonas paludicola]PFG16653.1 apolipoprotein N-acyltransferase [Propionicimonas paludicola]